MIHPVQELTLNDINRIKNTTKGMLLNKAMNANPGTKPNDWMLREIAAGGGTPTDFKDVAFATPAAAGDEHWAISTTDQGTINDLTNWLASASTVADNTWIGVMGGFDMAPHGVPPLTDLYLNGPSANLTNMQFKRGNSVLDYWQLEQAYMYPEVSWFSDRPVIWEQNESIQWLTGSSNVGAIKAVGLRGYTCERNGMHVSPEVGGLVGGLDPIQELSAEEITGIKNQVINELTRRAIRDNVVRNKSELCFRDLQAGDSSATDHVDIYIEEAQTAAAGNEAWQIDDDELTAGDLSNIIDTTAGYNQIKDKTYVGFYGWADKNAITGDISAIQFGKGGAAIDWWQVEHCYAYHDAVGGMTKRPVYYDQNDIIKLYLNAKVKSDKFVVFRGIVAEPWGLVVSEK